MHLTMEQVAIFWGWVFSLLGAFCLGYWVRHRQSMKRRQIAREMRERNRSYRDRTVESTKT
jgi:hypothetical protein